ncbi:hypothetical protein E8E78_09030 [Pseudomonas sp. BN505]|nr:hypothetical protein [Pseudomonas sp. BN605]MDH4856739.1 hypothetical protein [Pseudomonas sp. BN505]
MPEGALRPNRDTRPLPQGPRYTCGSGVASRSGSSAAPYATAALTALPRRTQASNTAAMSTNPR